VTWFRVDDKFHGHPKVKGLKAKDPLSLWLLCGSYCSDHPKLKGRVPRHVAADFAGSEASAVRLAAALVARGLWENVDGGWTFHDWDQYQPTADETEQRRVELSAKRSAAGRLGAERRWQTEAVANGKPMAIGEGNPDSKLASDSPVPSLPDPFPIPDPPNPPEGDGGGESTKPVPEHHATTADSQAVAVVAKPPPSDPRLRDAGLGGAEGGAWAEGVRRATGKPTTTPKFRDHAVIAGVLRTHAPHLRGQAAADWITGCAEAYAKDTRERRPSAVFSVLDWERWQNTHAWKPRPKVPPPPARAPEPKPTRPTAEQVKVLAENSAKLAELMGSFGHGGPVKSAAAPAPAEEGVPRVG
jgi:hypothetical protein